MYTVSIVYSIVKCSEEMHIYIYCAQICYMERTKKEI